MKMANLNTCTVKQLCHVIYCFRCLLFRMCGKLSLSLHQIQSKEVKTIAYFDLIDHERCRSRYTSNPFSLDG